MLGWSQAELAKAANVSRQTIADFERGAHMPINNNIGSIIAAFQAAGIEFIPENGGGVGVRFRKPGCRPLKHNRPNIPFRPAALTIAVAHFLALGTIRADGAAASEPYNTEYRMPTDGFANLPKHYAGFPKPGTSLSTYLCLNQ